MRDYYAKYPKPLGVSMAPPEYMMTDQMCRMRRSRINWFDLVGYNMAQSQCAWEREKTVWEMREAGFTYAAIGKRFGLTMKRARDIWIKSERHQRVHRERTGHDDYFTRPPVSFYLERHPYWNLKKHTCQRLKAAYG